MNMSKKTITADLVLGSHSSLGNNANFKQQLNIKKIQNYERSGCKTQGVAWKLMIVW